MENPVYRLHLPATRRSAAVFSSPHSGSDYPAAFLIATQLDPLQIRSSEDAFVDEMFAAAGFAVGRNTPFAGGYITQTYGRPRLGMQALQIEIDRSLYMDETRIERLPGFAEVAGLVGLVVTGLAELRPTPVPIAAE